MWTKDGLGIAHEEGRLEFERPQAGRAKLGLQVFADRINWLARIAESAPGRRGAELLTSIKSPAPPPEKSLQFTLQAE